MAQASTLLTAALEPVKYNTPVTLSTATPGEREITLSEVSWHDSSTDCWVVIYDRVYDITDFLDEKLDAFGLSDSLVKLLRSCFNNRTFYIEYKGYKSSHFAITSGVPRESNLGPLLFTLFINDHPGGSDILLECAGRDASVAFRGSGHSQHALLALSRFMIGELPLHERIFRKPGGYNLSDIPE